MTYRAGRSDSIRLRVSLARNFWQTQDEPQDKRETKVYVLNSKQEDKANNRKSQSINFNEPRSRKTVIFNKFNPYQNYHPELSHKASIQSLDTTGENSPKSPSHSGTNTWFI